MSPSASAAIAVHRDLPVVERLRRGRRSYLVERPDRGEVYELDEAEYFVWQQLDGQLDADELARRYEAYFHRPLEPGELAAFLRQLARQGLVDGPAEDPAPTPTIFELLDPERFFVVARWPITQGDRMLLRVVRKLEWVFTLPAKIAITATILLGWGFAALRAGAILDALLQAWSASFLLLIVVVGCFVVRSPRSIAHGVLCKRYAGQVPELGLGLIYFVFPSLYTDWSRFVWLRERDQRTWALAGALVLQLFVGAVGVIGWGVTVTGTGANLFWLGTLTVAFLNLVFLSANPLVPQEGYLMLVNWLGIPSLRERSLAAFGAWVLRHPPPEALTPRQWRGFVLFGGASLAYGAFMLFFHLWWAWWWLTTSYQGLGALAALALFAYLFQKPLGAHMADLALGRWLRNPVGLTRRRLWIAGTAFVIAWLPYPYHAGGPTRLLPTGYAEVHTRVEGRIIEVMVREGQHVAPGDALVRLDAREYETKLNATREQLASREADLRLLEAGPKMEEVQRAEQAVLMTAEEVEEKAVRLRFSAARAGRYRQLFADDVVSRQDFDNAVREWEMARAEHRVSERTLSVAEADLALVQSGARPEQIQATAAEVRQLRTIVVDLEQQVQDTLLVAQAAGRVKTPYVDQRVGQFLAKGDLVASIEQTDVIQGEVEVPEEDAAGIHDGGAVQVGLWSYPDETFRGRVVLVAPTASPNLDTKQWKVVRVLTELDNPDGRLKADLTGYSKISTGWRPLWRVLVSPIVRWFKIEFWSWLP